MKNTLLIAVTAFTAAAAFVLFGGVLRESPSAGASALPAARSAAAFEQTYSSAQNAVSLVLRLQQHLRESPDDAAAHALLGLAYLQRARETGDPSYYPKSEAVLRRALAIEPDNAVALSGLASLALTRHRFGEALILGRKAHALAPGTARNFGAIGDALVELGRYREGFAAFDTLARLKPSLAAYARVSYARELRGHGKGALAAMTLAAESATPGSEPAAWTAMQLGKLYFAEGDYARAEQEYRTSLGHMPGYAAALDALSHVEVAQGRVPRAIALERRAVETVPLPQYVAALGDLLRLFGRPQAAERQYALVGAIDRLQRSSGVRTDLEFALFRIDHGIQLLAAVDQARTAFRSRPSIDAADAVAWGLARTGRCSEAERYARLALRLGTKDALKWFHRGMIERCLGHHATARAWLRRALALNPGFSALWSPVARRYAR